MQQAARWERHSPTIVFGSLVLLAAIAPLGKEATHPVVFGIYRGLLLLLAISAGWSNLRDIRERRVCPYFLGALAVLGAWMALSVLLQTGSRFEGIYVFYKNALFGAAFVAAAAFSGRMSVAWRRNVLAATCGVTVVHLITAFVMAGGGRPLFSFFTNPNYFASFMLPGLGVALAYSVYGAGRQRFVALGCAAFLAYGILATVSRGATLAALLMLGVGFVRLAVSRFGTRRLAMAGAACLVAIVATLSAAYLGARQATPAVVDKFMDRGQRDPYNYARPLIWLSSIKMIGEHPVFGVGLGRYNYAAKRFTPAIEGTIARYRKFPNIAHNEYLQYAVESGLPAALLLMALAGYLFFNAWKRSKHVDAEARPIQEAAILAAIGVGSHALVDNNWTVPVLASTLAVVSQADLLPFRRRAAWLPRFEWTPTLRAVAVVALVGLCAQSIAIPAVGLHFNEAGHQAYAQNQFQRAESMHALAVGIIPDHPVLLDNLGMVYLDEFTKSHHPEHLEYAQALFRKSIAENPIFDIPVGHLETALIQSLTGRIETDRAIHQSIVETDRHLLAVNPYNPFIRRNLAEALYNLGQRKDAEAELLKAIDMEPNYAPGYLRLAQWATEDGAQARSDEYTQKALSIINRYRDATLEPFEALLLGRPEPPRE